VGTFASAPELILSARPEKVSADFTSAETVRLDPVQRFEEHSAMENDLTLCINAHAYEVGLCGLLKLYFRIDVSALREDLECVTSRHQERVPLMHHRQGLSSNWTNELLKVLGELIDLAFVLVDQI